IAGLDTGATWPTASEYFKYVSIDATTMRASTVMRSIPTSDTRTQASMTIPLSRTRSRTSMRLVPPAARSTAIVKTPYRVSVLAGRTATPAGGARQRRDPPFEQPELLPKFEIFLQHLLATRREMAVILPPVETNLLGLVDRADHQADADREELDLSERHLDVARDDEALVEHAIENVDQPGIAAGRSPCQV